MGPSSEDLRRGNSDEFSDHAPPSGESLVDASQYPRIVLNSHRLEAILSSLPNDLQQWVEGQGSDGREPEERLRNIAIAYDASRLIAVCPTLTALDRFRLNPSALILDDRGGLTLHDREAVSKVFNLAEKGFPIPTLTTEEWGAAEVEAKLEHVRYLLRCADGPVAAEYYSDDDVRNVVAKLTSPDFEVLEFEREWRTAEDYVEGAILELIERESPLVFKLHDVMFVVQFDPNTGAPPEVRDILDEYLGR